MRGEARRENYRMLDRLITEWESGIARFDREGERLLAAWHNATVAAIGGITHDLVILGALRLRRLYVRPTFRRHGIGQALASALLEAAQSNRPVLVNAGTDLAPAFWKFPRLHPRPPRRSAHPSASSIESLTRETQWPERVGTASLDTAAYTDRATSRARTGQL